MTPKKRVNINAIEHEINLMFMEQLKDGTFRDIDRRNKAELYTIAKRKLSKFLEGHPDNTFEMFKQLSIERAKDYQSYFPDFKTNSKQKTIYFDLENWIEVLENLVYTAPSPKYSVLNIDFEKQYEYRSLKNQIESHGFFNIIVNGFKTFIYTPELSYILSKERLEVFNCDTKETQIINGCDFIDIYTEGFKEGCEYFKKEFEIDKNILYGANAETYVKDIHDNYFHKKHEGINEGWIYYKKSYPIIFKKEKIKVYGFYAGIIFEVESMVKKYRQIFDKFENCEHQKHDDLKLKNVIAHKLIGRIGNFNDAKTIQPNYHYINDVLNEYNLTPIEAKEIVLQMKGSFPPEWNKNVVPLIVEHLGQITAKEIKPAKTDIYQLINDSISSLIKELQTILFKENFTNETANKYQEWLFKVKREVTDLLGRCGNDSVIKKDLLWNINKIKSTNTICMDLLLDSKNPNRRVLGTANELNLIETNGNFFMFILNTIEIIEGTKIEKNEHSFESQTKEQTNSEKTSKQQNPYPLIFKNWDAYQLFLELKSLTVKEKTIVADYSFIFHKLKKKDLMAINSVVTERAFITFLNDNYDTNIGDIKLPIRNPNNKQVLYNTTLNKYKSKILNE